METYNFCLIGSFAISFTMLLFSNFKKLLFIPIFISFTFCKLRNHLKIKFVQCIIPSFLFSRLSTYKLRFAVFCCVAKSCEYLHLFPFWQRPCLKKTHKTDLGSTSANSSLTQCYTVATFLPLETLGMLWTGLNNLFKSNKSSSPFFLVSACFWRWGPEFLTCK